MTTQRQPLRLVAYSGAYAGDDLEADLGQIQQASNRNNVAAGITGALLYDRGRFVQVVEGPHDAIGMLLGRLQSDPRIRDWHTLIDSDTGHRSCDGWALRVLRTDSRDMVDQGKLDAFRDMYLRTFKADAAGFIQLFTALLDIAPADGAHGG
jgi:hypothetical protein